MDASARGVIETAAAAQSQAAAAWAAVKWTKFGVFADLALAIVPISIVIAQAAMADSERRRAERRRIQLVGRELGMALDYFRIIDNLIERTDDNVHPDLQVIYSLRELADRIIQSVPGEFDGDADLRTFARNLESASKGLERSIDIIYAGALQKTGKELKDATQGFRSTIRGYPAILDEVIEQRLRRRPVDWRAIFSRSIDNL